jgi:hypothetical protein
LKEGEFVYGTNSLRVLTDVVTKCRWDTAIGDFSIHLAEAQPQFILPNINIKAEIDGPTTEMYCILENKFIVRSIRVYSNRVELDVSVRVGCDVYFGQTLSTTLIIYLTTNHTVKIQLEHRMKPKDPKRIFCLNAEIDPSNAIVVEGSIAEGRVLFTDGEKFMRTIGNDYLKAAISSLAVFWVRGSLFRYSQVTKRYLNRVGSFVLQTIVRTLKKQSGRIYSHMVSSLRYKHEDGDRDPRGHLITGIIEVEFTRSGSCIYSTLCA